MGNKVNVKGIDATNDRLIIHGIDVLEELEKKEKLLNQIKDIINRPYDSYIVSILEGPKRYAEIENLIKELENE